MSLFRLCRSRLPTRHLPTLFRSYATEQQTYIPPSQLENMRDEPRRGEGSWLGDKPGSPAFYTTRPSFYETLETLNEALKAAHLTLRDRGLYPLPAHARAALPVYPTLYMNKIDMAYMIGDGQSLTTTRHRRIVEILSELHECRRIARAAAISELEKALDGIIETFERPNKEARLNQGKRKPVEFDEYGRSYTVGRRKESSARVWLIPTVPFENQVAEQASRSSSTELAVAGEASTQSVNDLPITEIVVNNSSLLQYFPHLSDREAIIRPLKVAGLMGAYNVFVLVRGGGTTGQSGAIVTGIARGIVAQEYRRVQILAEHLRATYIDPINRELSEVDPALLAKVEADVKVRETMNTDMGMSMNMAAAASTTRDPEEDTVRQFVEAKREMEIKVRRAREAAETVERVLRKAKLTRRDPRMVERKKTGLAKAKKAYSWVKR